jgi:hypothetical protein
MNHHDYCPNGMTALLDAVGESVLALNGRIQREIARNEASAVIVIITDGHENSSKYFTFEKIQSMIKELESTGKWKFSYYGADLSDTSDAIKMGIKQDNSIRFKKAQMNAVSYELRDAMENYVMEKSNNIR